jgi:acetylornithine deacetylase/succinyl-diaminopimelate desuccinylase-like protein
MERLGYSNPRVMAMTQQRPNVIGEIGSGSPVLMLNGHIDTKPPGDSALWDTAPYDPVVREGVLYGLGTSDMKAAVGAMVYAGAALGELESLPGTLRVVLSADEEAGSRFGARFMATSEELRADAVVVAEPTGLELPWQYVATASRGVSAFRVKVRGTQMHSSLSDQVHSVNASVKLAQVLARMADEFRTRYPAASTSRPTVNLGVTLQGGVFFGVYPGAAEFGVDVRTVPGMTLEGLQADVEGFLEGLRREDPELQVGAEWVPELTWSPPSAISPGHPIVEAASWAAREVLGRDVPAGTMPAFTDGTHWSLAGIPSVPAFGPGSLLFAHQPNEHVGVDEIIQASRIYALMTMRFLEQTS